MSPLKPELLSALPAALHEAIELNDLAGFSALVWRDGEIDYFHADGKRNVEKNLPFQRDTIVQIFSMTKPITSAAMMMLIEEGKAALSDPITKWMPEFAEMKVLKNAEGPLTDTYDSPRLITIEDLMTHRSGFGYAFTSPGPIGKAYEHTLGSVITVEMSVDEWLARLATLPLLYPPGERFNYSHSTDVLGFLIGRISGMGFRDFLVKKIFEPLGMVDTDFYIPSEKRDRVAEAYFGNEASQSLELSEIVHRDRLTAYCSGGGGLYSTLDDYLKFERMMLNGGELEGVRILKPETVTLMTTNRLTQEQRLIPLFGMPYWSGAGFGLGVAVVLDPEKNFLGFGSVGAFSWGGYLGTRVLVDPQEKTILIFLTQDDPQLSADNVGQPLSERRMRVMGYWMKMQGIVYAALSAR